MKSRNASTAVDRLRIIGIVEGISYLVLLLVAMPLKYLAGFEQAVQVVGWAHGVLFILFVAAVAHVSIVRSWAFRRITWALVSSIIPFGTFVLDRQLRREQAAERAVAAAA